MVQNLSAGMQECFEANVRQPRGTCKGQGFWRLGFYLLIPGLIVLFDLKQEFGYDLTSLPRLMREFLSL